MLRALMRVAPLALGAVLSACSPGGDEDPEPVTGAPREVARVVSALETATLRRDFATICEELFSEAARERAGGDDCARLLRATAGDVERPRIELLSIDVDEEGAEVRVRTRAEGQAAIEETIELVREDGRWLIDGLGT